MVQSPSQVHCQQTAGLPAMDTKQSFGSEVHGERDRQTDRQRQGGIGKGKDRDR